MMAKRIESKDGEPILIRPFSLRDFRRFHQMNSAISPEARRAYRATLPQPRPPLTEVRRLILWGLVEIKLGASSIGVLRRFLAFIPRMAYIAFVAANPSEELVGFIFFNIVGRRAKHKYIAEPGMVLIDDYQGRGIGAGFLAATFEMVDDDVLLVFAEVYPWNHRIIDLIEKHGYRWVGTYKYENGEVVWLYARGRGANRLLNHLLTGMKVDLGVPGTVGRAIGQIQDSSLGGAVVRKRASVARTV